VGITAAEGLFAEAGQLRNLRQREHALAFKAEKV
jgi:hypothetical protein